MGFGTLFATVACFVIMATGAFLFTSNIMYTAEVVSTSFDVSSDLQYARLKTGIDIESASVLADDRINVSINNTGSMKILDSDFKYMDVYVMCDLGERKRIRYIDIDDIPLNVSEWTGEVNGSCDSINPGIFDPDEQMNIAINVTLKPYSIKNANWVKVVTSNGVPASRYFNLSNGSVWSG